MSRYEKSESYLARALRSIPLGSQTFSKSKTQYPLGVSPFFIQKAKGSRCWDIDGNEYIDFVSSLGAITLGYQDPDVDRAVQDQMKNGVLFSLAHPIETEVAEKIIAMVPSVEQVRFGKNGSDVTTAAVRLARAYTGRDHVALCGYHGWQDWSIGTTTRNRGIPNETRSLSHAFQYNDLKSLEAVLEQNPGQVAAIIIEPMSFTYPKDGFLKGVRNLADQSGAVLIFDEMVTGFRFANGGAQELFGVRPDLSTFGKGLANGYPLSAIGGKADIMKLMEEVFFSFTMGGEALSLAASLATLKKLEDKNATRQNRERGTLLVELVEKAIIETKCSDLIRISGHPSWSLLTFKPANGYSDHEIKSLFMQETFARGFLTFGTHMISYAHSKEDIEQLAKAYSEIFPILRKAVTDQNLREKLRARPIEPLFAVRD